MAVTGVVLLLSQARVTWADALETRKPVLVGKDLPLGSAGLAGMPHVITTVVMPPGIGTIPVAVGVNPATGYVYVASWGSHDITVISGTQAIAMLGAGTYPGTASVNPVTGYVYVANQHHVSVIGEGPVHHTYLPPVSRGGVLIEKARHARPACHSAIWCTTRTAR